MNSLLSKVVDPGNDRSLLSDLGIRTRPYKSGHCEAQVRLGYVHKKSATVAVGQSDRAPLKNEAPSAVGGVTSPR